MAEVLVRFQEPVHVTNDQRFIAQACGAPNEQGLWEGWLEFIPIGGGPSFHTPRETTQPNRTDAEYWATGLTPTYLEGALERAIGRAAPRSIPPPRPIFDRPAAEYQGAVRTAEAPERDAILNPFSVYEKGETLLRQELGALSVWHLVNISKAYGLSERPDTTLQAMSRAELVAEIVEAVRHSARSR